MSWQALAIPAVVIALAVRLDAVFVGPYWSLLDLVGDGTRRGRSDVRRHTILRRFLIPALVVGVVAVFDGGMSTWDASLLGAAGAGLVLWPAVFRGLEWAGSRRQQLVVYAAFLGAFAISGSLGHQVVRVVQAKGVLAYARENIVDWLVGLFLAVVLLTVMDLVADRVERDEGSV